MYYIYVLRCDDNSLYTGITTNLAQRLKEHYYKLGKGAKYTRAHNVVSLELVWQTETRSLALKREAAFKKFKKIKKEAIINDPSLFDDVLYGCFSHEPLATYVAKID
jgi:putative endonuclease